MPHQWALCRQQPNYFQSASIWQESVPVGLPCPQCFLELACTLRLKKPPWPALSEGLTSTRSGGSSGMPRIWVRGGSRCGTLHWPKDNARLGGYGGMLPLEKFQKLGETWRILVIFRVKMKTLLWTGLCSLCTDHFCVSQHLLFSSI